MTLTFRPRVSTKGVLLHASHTSPSQRYLEQHLAVKGRVMGLLEIGYHYVIDRDGKLLGCRPHNTMGAHCKGMDREWLGVCMAGGVADPGDFVEGPLPEDNFTPAQGETLRGLMDYLWLHYPGIPLRGHSEERPGHPHQCPPTDMEYLRQWLNTSATARTPSTSSPSSSPPS